MKNIFETITQLLFILMGFIVILLLYLGISLDFAQVKTVEFWIKVSVQLAFTMIVFNTVYTMDRNKRMHNSGSRFFKAYATNRMKVKYLEKEKLYDELEEAVKEENADRLEKKCNRKLHKLCTRINYSDVIGSKSIEELITENEVNKRIKRLTKLINKIRAGEIKIRELKSKSFLGDKEITGMEYEEYDYNETVYELKRNVKKGVIFLISSIMASSITYAFVSPNFLLAFINNVTLLIGAAFSGFVSSAQNVKKKTLIYEKRNAFLLRYLNISEEYIPEK